MITGLYVFVSVVGTAAWAIGMQQSSIDVRLPLIAAGLFSAMSFLVYPPHIPDVPAQAFFLGFILFVYQHSIALSIRAYGASIQAAINCNVVVIVLYMVFRKLLPVSLNIGLLCLTAVSSVSALVLSVHPQH